MTSLAALRNAWEDLAKQDALGAILTDPSKTGGRWDLGEFMQTGETEMDSVLRHLEEIEQAPDLRGMALDFGCGVGRLTQAMARRFVSCIGVDISLQMIRSAQSLNRHLACSYQLVTANVLPFADATFSFIYSNIVLQHVPRRYAVEYLREFERVLTPGGILVFGVQDHFAAPDISSRMIRVRQILRLRSRLRAALGRSGGDMQMHLLPERLVRAALRGSRVVDVQLTNTAAKDFNGRLRFLKEAPAQGYVGKQYCVVKDGTLA
jgi:SAM-dependent methyltransferase